LVSPAWFKFNWQVPVPLVISTVALVAVLLLIEQTLPITVANVIGFPDPPPVAVTIKLVLKTALAGAFCVIAIVWVAWFTISVPSALLAAKFPCAK
jgi:hypothetical protein